MATKRTKNTMGRAAVGITIVALAAVGLLGYKAAAGTSNPTHYRTVTAGSGTITQILAVSGTVHHVTQSSVSFPTSGIVTAVNVKAGDTVTAGQALASINSTPLQNAVLAADAAYKSAISQYQTDQQTYASSTTTTSTTKAATTSTSRAASGTSSAASSGAPSGTGSPSGGGTGGPGGGGTTDPAAAVKSATDAIAALQAGVATVDSALPIFVSECIPLIPTTSPVATVTHTVTATVTHTVTETATVTVTAAATGSTSVSTAASSAAPTSASPTSPSTSASPTATSSSSGAVSKACQDAIDQLTASNTTLPVQMTAANVALTAAVKALDAEAASLTQQAAALKQQQAGLAAQLAQQAAAAKQQSASLSGSNSALQAAAAAGLSRSGGGGTVTAATLITDQSTIETARIALAQAQDQLSQATLTSPIAGKVASMPFILGQQASATATAVIIGTGAIEVTVPVPLAKRAQVANGQAATVTSTIGGTTLQGTITRISLLPTTTSSFSAAGAAAATGAASTGTTSTTTYATVITIASGGDLLPELSRVGATITTKTVNAAVVLPVSAITPTSTGSGTVQVVTNGILSTKRVVTGAVGDVNIEIVSGVTAGESVVIADVDKAIPGASIAASRGAQTAAQQQQPQDFPAGGGSFGGNGGGALPGGAPPS